MRYNFTKSFTSPGWKFAVGLLIALGTQAHGQIINTYAGNGFGAPNSGAYSGDGGQAINAEFYHSTGVALDDSGNLYIADSQNDVIRKVTASTGIISTVAGVGGANGYNGDGRAATTAEMSDPWGVQVDDSGNIYIADYGNHAIRKVTKSTGIISTVAGTPTIGTRYNGALLGDGGPATAAHLAYPIGLGLDDSANIYIADQYDFCIRKVTVKTGIITTIAGIGAGSGGFSGNGGPATNALLYFPSGVAVDDSGNVYIADQWNNEIRVVSKKTGIIKAYAGNGTGAPGLYSGAYSGDGGQATAAQLNYATGVGKDDSGNIYIADWANEVVRKVTAKTGIITTVAGDNALGAGFNGDNQPATAAELNAPSGVTTNACGDIYIADYMNNRVRIVSGVPGKISVFPPTPSVCGGSSDTLTASGASSYRWSPSTGLSDTTGSIVIANPTITTTYIITGSGGVCVGVATPDTIVVKVTQTLPLTVLPQPSPSVCSGQGVTLKISGSGSNFMWSPSVGLSSTTGDSVVATPLVTTTYTVAGTVAGGCTSIGTDTVKIIPAPPLTIQPLSPSTCAGQPVTLSVPVSGSDYTWTPSTDLNVTTGDSVNASPLAQTTYTVTGTDSLGCGVIGYDTVSVRVGFNKPLITDTDNVLTTSATEGNQWYRNGSEISGANGEKYTATDTGCYWDIATNVANGCSSFSDTICITPSGINLLSINPNLLSIYPNPTDGEIYININSSVTDVKDWNLQITDVLGRKVYTRLSLNYNNDIDLSDLPGGVYFIIVTDESKSAVFPIVKQNY